MTTLIVTASSKSKCEFTDKPYAFGSHSFADKLDTEFKQQLRDSRLHLASTLKFKMGTDIEVGSVKIEPEEYLPGYIRYTGRTYSKITDAAWQALDGSSDVDMVILSALYGLMRYNEPVRNYEIKQADKFENTKIQTFWKRQGAKDWLTSYIHNSDIDDVKFVLSDSYSNIISRDALIAELRDEGISAEDKQLKDTGRASMLRRGEYINDLLLGEI
ncbi:MAG: peroxide stress protein YaaA [Candidatus Kariarchaeaceae archaeon]|jgi:cytoplasmic iron level regulating protein YaaA (DUF328/UPF0246 family)